MGRDSASHQNQDGATKSGFIRSALDFDLVESCKQLLQDHADVEALGVLREYLTSLHHVTSSTLLTQCAHLLLEPELILPVSARFRPLITDLVSRLFDHSQACSDASVNAQVLHCFATLVGILPEIYDVTSEFIRSLDLLALYQSVSRVSIDALNQLLLDLYRLVSRTPHILTSDRSASELSWIHHIVTDQDSSIPLATRLLALHLFALQQGLSESTKQQLEQRCYDMAAREPSTSHHRDASVTLLHDKVTLDVNVLEAIEFHRLGEAKKFVRSTKLAFRQTQLDGLEAIKTDSDSSPSPASILQLSDLSHRVCCVGGILLYRSTSSNTDASSADTSSDQFVETQSVYPSLSDIALHLSARLPILLSGPPSSGKSSLIRHVCHLVKGAEVDSSPSHLLTIQLGDQSGIDAKQLLGSFISSPTQPGVFEWSEGALTRAVRQGKWIVLEDIDKAGSEVLSLISRLVQQLGPTKPLGSRPFIDLGNRGKVFAADGFAIFATRSVQPTNPTATASYTRPSRPTFHGSSHWSEVFLNLPTQLDVKSILQSRFQRLSHPRSGFVDRLVQTWYKLQSATAPSATSTALRGSAQSHQAIAGSVRTPTLRDLIKWCRRVEHLVAGDIQGASLLSNPVQQEEIFIEACDIFLGSIPPSSAGPTPGASKKGKSLTNGKGVDRFSALVELLAEELGLSAERAWWALQERVPDLAVRSYDHSNGLGQDENNDGSSRIKVGRCELPRRPRSVAKRAAPINRNFAMNKPSLILLERLAAATSLAEPLLLVGETGTGKTTVVQHLASLLGQPMTALNLSQQTESGDLLGAFKPLDPKLPATELHDLWSTLFARTFSSRRNARFVEAERKAFVAGKWSSLASLWRESSKMALQRKKANQIAGAATSDADGIMAADGDVKPGTTSRKKRKTDRGATEGSPAQQDDARSEAALDAEWHAFDQKARDFGIQHGGKKKNLVFSFVEGPLVKALRQGDWILLDEINLAAAETLDSLTGLLQSPSSSITLTERGDLEPIPRHPNFRLFACMNPATDVGKKDLPASLRSRFTEIYVPSPDSDREALTSIVDKYIGEHALGDRGAVMDVAECYAEIRRLAQNHELADGANQRPHFSIRTLSRALTFATDIAPQYGLRRGLWEGFVMAFTLLLDASSARLVCGIIERHILAKAKNARSIAVFVPPAPKGTEEGKFVQVGPFWLPTGPLALDPADDYVLTPSVQSKLVGLSRAALTRRFPVLIQGPTSAGKTSAVEYLARRTGHRFVRINNHEHTDIQEYIGSYASDPDSGKLTFQEGLLVKALRRGDWIVLDELNLAPTDVLEALNRLLDDNRELVIPETGEVVKPHPRFMLFATQNPPGLYAGRKVLSRAFRNRFLELHFDDVPRAELETILTNRCKIAPSYSSRIVGVFEELQKRRQAGRVFETKQAFVTLRDLFRWGNREAIGYQQLAENGYMLIAERARRNEDKQTVQEVIEKVMKVKINVDSIYLLEGPGSEETLARIGARLGASIAKTLSQTNIVRTSAFRRLLCLVATSLRYNEPVLLVGETGAGKTSVCELLATAFGRHLYCVNCHQNTDTADLLGGQRPLRNRAMLQASAKKAALDALNALRVSTNLTIDNKTEEVASYLETVLSKFPSPLSELSQEDQLDAKAQLQTALRALYQSTALFEWQDGPLVQAMRSGDHLLLDEISLADDSVLERLNSVLEPGRTLVLAEKSTSSNQQTSDISASQLIGAEGFQVLATMNPGGDYGKKELSPALRNRFTEIWVPHVDVRSDLIQILDAQWKAPDLKEWTEPIIDFTDWFIHQVGGRDQSGLGLRDLLTWASFMNQVSAGEPPVLAPALGFAHAASLIIIDGLGALPATAAMSPQGLHHLKSRCLAKIATMISPFEYDSHLPTLFQVRASEHEFGVGPFSIARGTLSPPSTGPGSFSFGALTSASNAMRVLRALSVPAKSVLLEGSPGAGKTSLIAALAAAAGRPLTRINLSDQTELVDLFGSDMPLEGGGPGEFAWRDAAFLTAMQRGEWVLLDEMNLASQTVLEGLNSCLDHRGTVYVPELGRSFQKHSEFRIFAAQNPQHQGGGRKGLPKSFLNRFIKVHIEELNADDIFAISHHLYPDFDQDKLRSMIRFNFDLHTETVVKHTFGRIGAPWEFNLRDLMRWLDLLHSNLGLNVQQDPIESLASLYVQRFRIHSDRQAARELYRRAFDSEPPLEPRVLPTLSPKAIRIGHAVLSRGQLRTAGMQKVALLQRHLGPLETLIDCVQKQWLAILVGPTGVGKTSIVRLLAHMAGARLEEVQMNSGTDTMDLIGTFEQYDPQAEHRHAMGVLLQQVDGLLDQLALSGSASFSPILSARETVKSELQRLSSSSTTDNTDLTELQSALDSLLSWSQQSSDEDFQRAIDEARQSAVQANSGVPSSSGRFEWVEGQLLKALREGHWLLLDNANLCSASVLDRLNSLFEPNGSLIISERGAVDGEIPVVRPHPNFRVFMCLDPRHGELSRAMRNRGIEIALIDQPETGVNDMERLQVLSGLRSVNSTLPTLNNLVHESTQKQLMAACIEDQRVSRGLLTDTSEMLDMQLPSSLVEMSSWATGELALTNSRLAAAIRSACVLTDFSVDDSVKTSFVIRSTPDDASELIWSLLMTGILPMTETLSSFVQAWKDSRQLLLAWQPDQTVLKQLAIVPKDLMCRLPLDLRYDGNVVSLLQSAKATVGPLERIDLLLRALLSVTQLQRLPGTARDKKAEDLSILERSALLQGTTASFEDDEAAVAVRLVFPSSVAITQMTMGWLQQLPIDTPTPLLKQASSLLFHAAFLGLLCSVAELDFSSIQVLVGSMSTLLRDMQAAGFSAAAELAETLGALGGSLKLTSGFAMNTVWNFFGAEEGMQANLSRLITDEISSQPTLPRDLVHNALDIAATLRVVGVRACSPTEARDMMDLAMQGLKMIRSEADRTANMEKARRAPKSLSSESLLLHAVEVTLGSSYALSDRDHEVSKVFVQLLEENAQPATQSAAVTAKAAVWASGQIPLRSRLLLTDFSWVRRSWNAGMDAVQTEGPAELIRPLVLRALLETRAGNRNLREQAQHEAATRRMIQSAGASLSASSPTRLQRMKTKFCDLVRSLSFSFLDMARREGVCVPDVGELSPLSEFIPVFADLGNISSLSVGTTATVVEWSSFLNSAAVIERDVEFDSTLLGQAWISLALVMLRLYLPNVAIDPIVSRRTMASFKTFCRKQIQASLDLESFAEASLTGQRRNHVIADLQAQLQAVDSQTADQKDKDARTWRGSNLKLLSQFYRETHAFVKEVVSQTRMSDLMTAIEFGFDDKVEQREESLQASLLSFGDRLRKTFSSLRDIVEPVHVSLLQLQLGFRVMVQGARVASRSTKVTARSDIIRALVSFPTTRSSSSFRQLDVPILTRSKPSELDASLLVVSGASIAFDRGNLGHGIIRDPRTLRYLSRAYEQLFQLWSLDRERAKRDEEEASSLYKSRKIEESIELDADAEEKDFLALFPEYDADVLEGTMQREANSESVDDRSSSKTMLPKHLYVPILHIHETVFAENESKEGSQVFEQYRDELVVKLLRKHYSHLSEELDQAGAAFGLTAAIQDTFFSVESTNQFNFYLDGRPSEVKKATAIVQELRDRLSDLIKDWPEQMVLQHIRDRCDAVLRLDASSPVARMLSALEQLLSHTEDWEGFASSETSIKINREKISGQIIEWRRLELSCWAELLNSQARAFENDVAEWWFRVYEILIRGTRGALSEGQDAFRQHVEKMIDAIDQFIRSSPLGQFEARLCLLESYGRYLDLLVRFAPPKESEGFQEIGLVLQNVTRFFRQFSGRVSTALNSQRSLLEKDITGFIKLASWKDINIHALKQSAQKTHRQLHKTIRKFRDVLRQPIDPLLASHLDALSRKEMPSLSGSDLQRRDAPLHASVWQQVSAKVNEKAPDHIQNLSRTLDVLQQMSVNTLWPKLTSSVVSSAISDFADEIVDRQQQLSKLTPAFAKGDNEKALKNLTSRKRKAWTDLLKELRRIGLSSYLKTDVVQANRSVMQVYTQPVLTANCLQPPEEEMFANLEQLHFRLLATLPKVRDSLQSHSPDLSTAELQRGINYIEDITHLVLRERGRLSVQLQAMSALEQIASRLSLLCSDRAGPLIRAVSVKPFTDLAEFLNRLEAALDEIRSKAPGFLATSAFGRAGSDSLLGKLTAAQTQLSRHRQSLIQIASTALSGTSLLFVSEKERDDIKNAEAYVEEIETILGEGEATSLALESLLHPTRIWVASRHDIFARCWQTLRAELEGSCERDTLQNRADSLISSVLQIAQDVRSSASARAKSSTDDEDDLPDKAIVSDLKRLESQAAYLRSTTFLSHVQEFLNSAHQGPRRTLPEDVIQLQLARLYPFLHEYCEMLRGHIVSSANFSRSLLKLDHVLCNLMTALASKGFCKPPEEQEGDEGEGDDGEQLDGGTGLGDGTGAKDITDQMEDDDQIEELQKDDPLDEGEEGEKTEREKNAKEADQDFGGDMEDISVDGNEEEGEEQDDQDGEQDQPEDAIGDVDPLDPNAVDEKIWDGKDEEKDEKESKDDDTTNKDLGGDGNDDQEPESVPKSNDSASKDQDQKKEKAGENGQQEDGEETEKEKDDVGEQGEGDAGDEQGEEENEEEGEEEDDDAEIQGEGGGRQVDQEADQGENLDLKDDLNMDDGDGGSQEDDSDNMDDLSDVDQPPVDEEAMHRRDNEEDLNDLVDEDPEKEDLQKAEDQDGETVDEKADEDQPVSKEDGEEAMDEDEGNESQDEDQHKDSLSKNHAEDPSKATEDLADPFNIDAVDQGAEDGGQDETGNQQQSSRSKQGRRTQAPDNRAEADDGSMNQDDSAEAATEAPPESQEAAGQRGSRAQHSEKEDKSTDQGKQSDSTEDPSNPLRSIGEALDEFRRRMEEIQAARDQEDEVLGEQADRDGEGMPEEGDLEHVANDDHAEMQALGAAQDQDEVKNLGDLGIEDQDESKDAKPRLDPQDIEDDSDRHEAQPLPKQPEQEQDRKDGQQKAFMPSDIKPSSSSLSAEQEALLDEDGDANMAEGDMEASVKPEIEDENMTPIPDETRESADLEIRKQLEMFRSKETAEERLAQAGDLWRSYASLTADLAFSLCEQLRLILAPTLATRLNGDFRTGKRLNMRKIVPFIASDFAKDKIWLRRTKPSSREYQVMLAIDDSRSMSESRSAHLAYQTLALVTGALSRLEVGDVSICRFGEDVDSLHDFGAGTFNDQNGAHVIDKLGFQQKSTNVLKLVEKSLDRLAEARASRSSSSASQAADLWQLEIIISDGICQDHAKLRALLRRAAEQRVMLVFVVIDSLSTMPSAAADQQMQQRSSILEMSNVSYYTDANGKMQLKMERYMDTFPFDYYVVVRDVEALPEVLSATLRQWVEKIRETES